MVLYRQTQGIDMTLPTKICLTKEEASKLSKLNDKTMGVKNFVTTVTQQGEDRIAELQQEGRIIWEDLKNTYDLDLETINYTLSDDGKWLVPVGMKL